MDFYKTFLDLLIENKMQSDEGNELRAVLQAKIQEGQMCLDQLTIGLKHSKSQLQIIENHLKRNVTASQRQSLLAKKAAFLTVQKIWNFATQIQLLSIECKALQEKLYFAETDWDKSLQSRSACNYMYEYGNNLNKMIGKEFLEMVSSLLGDEGVEEIKRLKKPISKFFEEHREKYYSVRNETTAHRDQNSLNQIDIITSSEWSERIQELHEFEVITLPLGGFAENLIKAGERLLAQAFK